jgi:murein DD-endopeptidase MepM/ murein hydrolase activator NlpD
LAGLIPPTLLLSAALAAPVPAAPLPCDPKDAHVSAAAVAQGGVALLEVAPREVEPTATWQAKPLRFWREEEGPWRALVGVDLKQPPGDARVTLTTHPGTCTVALSVKPVDFPEERIQVARRFVELNARDRARADREAARLATLFRSMTAQRLWNGPFRIPLEGVRPSSSFGRRRIVNGQPRSPHTGVDLGAPSGTAIHAMQRGRVVLDAALFFSGRTVVIDHGLGLFSLYGHLSESRVSAGRMVEPDEIIGLVGATGRATAPHLHWAVRLGDARVDGLDLVGLTAVQPPAASRP